MAKLGSHQPPAVARVRSAEDAEEIVDLAQERGWKVIVGVEPDELEDLSDLHRLMNAEVKTETKISGNDYCACRRGLKFKKCSGAAIESPGPPQIG